MAPLELARLVLLALHLLGLAALVGASLAQLRRRERYALAPALGGAIAQIVTGVGLVAARRMSGLAVDEPKLAVKLGIAILVLAAAIVAVVRQHRGGRAGPWLHTAGGLAAVNVLVAVLWQ